MGRNKVEQTKEVEESRKEKNRESARKSRLKSKIKTKQMKEQITKMNAEYNLLLINFNSIKNDFLIKINNIENEIKILQKFNNIMAESNVENLFLIVLIFSFIMYF